MGLSNEQRKAFRAALLAAYPQQSRLELMLDDELDWQLNQITQRQDSYELVLNDLVKWVESQDRSWELAIAAARYNPTNTALPQFIETALIELLPPAPEGVPSTWIKVISNLPGRLSNDILLESCQGVWSEIGIHQQQVIQDLANQELSLWVKWLVIIALWFKRYPQTSTSSLPSFVVFVERLSQHPEVPAPQRTALSQWIESIQPELGIAGATALKPFSAEQAEFLKQVRGALFITVQVPITATEGSDRLLVRGFLSLEVDPSNQLEENQLVPLADLTLMGHSEVTEQSATLAGLEAQLPEWIQQSERQLEQKCFDLKKNYGLGTLPTYELVVEFFLPYEYLSETIECWTIPRFGRLRQQRQSTLGRSYKLAIRSSDRLSDPQLLNRFNQTCQEIKTFLAGQPSEMTIQDKIARVRELTSLLASRDDIQLAKYLKQYLSLLLSCPFCCSEYQQERERVWIAVLEAGLPIVVWSRNHQLPNLEASLLALLSRDCLNQFDELLEQVKRAREDASSAQDLGHSLALVSDEPTRLVALRQFLQDGRLSA